MREVTQIERVGSAYRVHHRDSGGANGSALYHAVFLTIGFGNFFPH